MHSEQLTQSMYQAHDVRSQAAGCVRHAACRRMRGAGLALYCMYGQWMESSSPYWKPAGDTARSSRAWYLRGS